MIDEMGQSRGSAARKQCLAECFKGPDFVRIQDLKRYFLQSCFFGGKLDLAASNTVTQQANAGIANKCTA